MKNKFLSQRKSLQITSNNPWKTLFFYKSKTPEDVESEIKTLKNNKASGPSKIPTKIFKTFAKPLSKPLADLINLSFSTGKLLASLKTDNSSFQKRR